MKSQTGFKEITPQELHQWQDSGDKFFVIDTLPSDLFEKRRIPGAVNACVYEVIFLKHIESHVTDKDQKIVLYGSSPASLDAVTAAEKLIREGYRKVWVLAGGIAAWQAAGYSLEGDAAAVAVEPATLFFDDGSYTVDTQESIIEWTGRNPNNKHYGRLRLTGGNLTVKENRLSGSFEIDMDSIENFNLAGDELQPVLIAHLKSDDFFFIKLFPNAFFTISAAEPVEDPHFSSPNFKINGIFELRGVQKELNFLATLGRTEKGDILAEAHFDFDRTKWNVIYGSSRFFEHLGMHLVFDPISIQLRVVAHVSGV
jgi:rhodanese-related sulfurtransferase